MLQVGEKLWFQIGRSLLIIQGHSYPHPPKKKKKKFFVLILLYNKEVVVQLHAKSNTKLDALISVISQTLNSGSWLCNIK